MSISTYSLQFNGDAAAAIDLKGNYIHHTRMRIDIKNTKVYLISPGTEQYANRLVTVFARLIQKGFQRVEFVRSLPGDTTTSSLTNTVIDIFKRELSGDTPFIILEDDCAVFTEYNELEVPDDYDALYLGVSMWGYNHPIDTLYQISRPSIKLNTSDMVTSYNDVLTKISGMTSTHAILYKSRDFIRSIITHMNNISKMFNNVPHDLLLAVLQKSYQVYALKSPMFYQDITLGGQESSTKLIYNGEVYKEI